MSASSVAGFVLAGGRSSRMGTNKALLQLDGETLVARTARAVEAAAGSAVIVGDPGLYEAFRYPVIPDTVRDCGPLGGIAAALAHSDAAWNLIVACDMPGVTAIGLQILVRETLNAAQVDVLLPYLDGRPQPLCAMYHRRSLLAIQQSLRSRRLKIMDAIGSLRVQELPAFDETLFENVNTPEEWSTFVSR